MKKLLMAAVLALAAGPALSQSAPAPSAPAAPAAQAAPRAPLPDADPALWMVRDEDTTIYLFGTFHLLDGRPWFNDEVKTAFDASQELVLEALIPENVAELQPMILRYAIDPNGRRLSQRLTAEEMSALNAALAPLGAPAGAFDPFEPWFASMMLTTVAAQRLGIDATNGPESLLSRHARERNIPIAELESMEWQIRLFDSMPEAQQLSQLRDTLGKADELDEAMQPMLTAWSTGDVDGLQQIVDGQGAEDAELHRILFTDRNANWARWIQERMARPGTVFIAVGAGHLTGNDSVQAVLQGRGIRATRVPHAPAH
jgi:uncharacterized protein YbaP (TraB family)